MRQILFLLILSLISFNVFTASAADENVESLIRFPVEKYQLDNGLTVILHQDNSVPTVSYHTWFRVGSKDEEPGYTGIAHLFEHMMFKGAARYTGRQFETLLQANGAENNAFTTRDYTGYYEDLPSSKLELVMDIESDRMVNLKVDAKILKSEKEVVKEERRMRVDNSLYGKLGEVINSTVFKVHPYKWPIIGWMKDIDRINVEKCLQFYKDYYAPNNAVLVIAGDIEIKKTKELVKKYYSSLKRSNLNRRAYQPEPVQKGYRFQEIKRDVQSQTFAVVYQSPQAGHPEAYALDLLQSILGSGESSRLYKSLVYRAQMATSASAYNSSMMDNGKFSIYVSLKPGASFQSARKKVMGLVFKVRNQLVTEKELQKAKNQVMKSYVDSLKTVNGRAESLALNEVYFNDYSRLFSDLGHYSKVTVEQIREVAKKYLTVEKASVVLVSPKKKRRTAAVGY